MLPKYYKNETMMMFMSFGTLVRPRRRPLVADSFCLLWLFFSSV